MKLNFVMGILITLSLNASFAMENVVDVSPEQRVLSATTLPAVYQDFLGYYGKHGDRFEPCIQPAVLFAEELSERHEEGLAFQIFSLEVADASKLSAHETSVVHDIIRRTFYRELVHILDDQSMQPWLRDMVRAVYSPDPELFEAARLASSDDRAVKREGALRLARLTGCDGVGLGTRRAAAGVVVYVRDADWKSVVGDEELMGAGRVLVDAAFDPEASFDVRLWAADVLMETFNANNVARLVTQEQGQAIFDGLLNLVHNGDTSSRQSVRCAETVLRAMFPHVKEHYCVPMGSEPQRHAALNIILGAVPDN